MNKENLEQKKERIIKILEILKNHNYGLSMLGQMKNNTHFEILIATILSVRAKDKITIPITKKLFKKYNTSKKIIDAKTSDIEKILEPIGFYKMKTKRIKNASKQILDNFNNIVPNNEKDLLSITGVGRKVANCILNYCFNIPAIAVDIHVHRISNRLGLVKTKYPEKTEIELKKIAPKEYWILINEFFVLHGQNTCKPIGPECERCKINIFCKKIIK